MGYDFASLSCHDFEALMGDLLGEEMAIRLESFGAGRDGGIDLRFARSRDDPGLVIQCKHYHASGYSSLKSNIKKESRKVKRLAPRRYILATTVALTPARKDELAALVGPSLAGPGDIIGLSEIEALLKKHSAVERRNFKLWMTSTAVLERILYATTYVRSEALIEEIKSQVRIYAPNESYRRAIEILDESHVCIIAGPPGIGKTLLARMLLLNYVDRGYEALEISSDIDEANAVYSPEKRQFFYYDDFLGMAFDITLGKNEDARLDAFLKRVIRSSGKRVVLTTREYILRRAVCRFERIDSGLPDNSTCIVDLKDYTIRIRAHLLYNHVYFSRLAHEVVQEFCTRSAFERVLKHPSFSPRMIELGIRDAEKVLSPNDDLATHLVRRLEDPSLMWHHAMRSAGVEEYRYILEALLFFPGRAEIHELETAARDLISRRELKVTTRAFREGLRQLEGSFLSIIIESYRTVQFVSPTISDFLLSQLDQSPDDLNGLVRSMCFFELPLSLIGAASSLEHGKVRWPGLRAFVDNNQETVAAVLERTLGTKSSSSDRANSGSNRGLVDRRLRGVLTASRASGWRELERWVRKVVAEVRLDIWHARNARREDAVLLAKELELGEPATKILASWVVEDLEEPTDFEAAALLLDAGMFPEDAAALERLHEEFNEVVLLHEDYLLEDVYNSIDLETAIEEVEDLGSRLNMEPVWDRSLLDERVTELRDREAEEDESCAEVEIIKSDIDEWEFAKELFASLSEAGEERGVSSDEHGDMLKVPHGVWFPS